MNDVDGWFPLAGSSVGLNASGKSLVTLEHFLRYVRWVTDGGVAGNPLVTADGIAKEVA